MKATLRPRLLDLFCGAGGAAMGYYRAGSDSPFLQIQPLSSILYFTFHLLDWLHHLSALGTPPHIAPDPGSRSLGVAALAPMGIR